MTDEPLAVYWNDLTQLGYVPLAHLGRCRPPPLAPDPLSTTWSADAPLGALSLDGRESDWVVGVS